ncbi:MAG: zinc-ribbon domain-containing protein [Oscillospiraceae bacterium]|nr:zinc-ribbon domain-containing protein [Oscillospiraceae bacterium]
MLTMFCTNCGNQNLVNARFCTSCGNSLDQIATPPRERSTASKVLFGTYMTNGLVMIAGGIVSLFMGMYFNSSAKYQLYRLMGGDNYVAYFQWGGGLLFIIGVCCICIHYVKK